MTTPARIVVLADDGTELGHVVNVPRDGAPSWRTVCVEHGEYAGRAVAFPTTAAYALLAHLSGHGAAS